MQNILIKQVHDIVNPGVSMLYLAGTPCLVHVFDLQTAAESSPASVYTSTLFALTATSPDRFLPQETAPEPSKKISMVSDSKSMDLHTTSHANNK